MKKVCNVLFFLGILLSLTLSTTAQRPLIIAQRPAKPANTPQDDSVPLPQNLILMYKKMLCAVDQLIQTTIKAFKIVKTTVTSWPLTDTQMSQLQMLLGVLDDANTEIMAILTKSQADTSLCVDSKNIVWIWSQTGEILLMKLQYEIVNFIDKLETSSQSGTISINSKPAPSNTAPSKPAPSNTAPSKPAPATTAPSKPAPATTAPSKPAPATTAPSKPAPSAPVFLACSGLNITSIPVTMQTDDFKKFLAAYLKDVKSLQAINQVVKAIAYPPNPAQILSLLFSYASLEDLLSLLKEQIAERMKSTNLTPKENKVLGLMEVALQTDIDNEKSYICKYIHPNGDHFNIGELKIIADHRKKPTSVAAVQKPTNSTPAASKPSNSTPAKPANSTPSSNKPTNSTPVPSKPTNSTPVPNKPSKPARDSPLPPSVVFTVFKVNITSIPVMTQTADFKKFLAAYLENAESLQMIDKAVKAVPYPPTTEQISRLLFSCASLEDLLVLLKLQKADRMKSKTLTSMEIKVLGQLEVALQTDIDNEKMYICKLIHPDGSHFDSDQMKMIEKYKRRNQTAVNSKPTNSTPAKPTNSTPAKPTNSTPAKPTNSTPAKPTNSTPIKPTNSTPAKPTNSTPAKPTNSTPIKPTNSTPAKPTNSTPAKPTPVSSKPTDVTTKPAITSSTSPSSIVSSKPVFMGSQPISIPSLSSTSAGGIKIPDGMQTSDYKKFIGLYNDDRAQINGINKTVFGIIYPPNPIQVSTLLCSYSSLQALLALVNLQSTSRTKSTTLTPLEVKSLLAIEVGLRVDITTVNAFIMKLLHPDGTDLTANEKITASKCPAYSAVQTPLSAQKPVNPQNLRFN